MSYKISMMISMVFVVLFSFFAVDMLMIQNSFSLLDSKSVNISYFLAKNGDISSDVIDYIESYYQVNFELLSDSHPSFGDNIIYNLSTTYHPFVIGYDLEIKIQRMTVVGYFN